MQLADKLRPEHTALIIVDMQNDFCAPDGVMARKGKVIAGVSTQICVETAIRNGFDLGYKIVLPEDLVATTSNDPETQKRTLVLVQKTYGVVTNSRELAQILTQSAS
jgi:nicotinamidase-related amidase